MVGDAKSVNTAKREPETEERLLRKEEEAQKELRPAKSDSDATGTTLEKQTGERKWREGGKPRMKIMNRQTGFLKEESHVMMN